MAHDLEVRHGYFNLAVAQGIYVRHGKDSWRTSRPAPRVSVVTRGVVIRGAGPCATGSLFPCSDTGIYAHLGMAEVEQFVIFVAAYELNTFIDEHETCPIASQSKNMIAFILNICIDEFDENIYVVDTRKRYAQGISNVLQEGSM